MRIRPDYKFSRHGKTLLRQDLVTDAFAYIEEICDPLLFYPLPGAFMKFCRSFIIGWRYVIKWYDYPVRVPYFLYTHFLPGLHGQDACPIMRHRIIYVGYYKIIGLRSFTRSAGKYFFTYSRHFWIKRFSRNK